MKLARKYSVCIVMPCWNEEKSISPMVDLLQREAVTFANLDVTALFVDDGSSDSTLLEIQAAKHLAKSIKVECIELGLHEGKVSAQAVGLLAAKDLYDFVVFADSDGQFDTSGLNQIVMDSKNSGKLQVGIRNKYRRSITNSVGVWLLSVFSKFLGVKFQPYLSEYIIIPRSFSTQISFSNQLGIFPIISVINSLGIPFETFSFDIKARLDGSESGKWSFGALLQKALLELLAQPWALLRRLFLISSLFAGVLLSYALWVGVSSIIAGTFMGISSVLVTSVLIFCILALSQLATLGLVVVLSGSVFSNSGGARTFLEKKWNYLHLKEGIDE